MLVSATFCTVVVDHTLPPIWCPVSAFEPAGDELERHGGRRTARCLHAERLARLLENSEVSLGSEGPLRANAVAYVPLCSCSVTCQLRACAATQG